MATKLFRSCIINNIPKKPLSTQAATAPQLDNVYALPRRDSQLTTLPSGTVVASLENNEPVSRVSVLFKAGSRFETFTNAGASHMVRLCAGLGTKEFTSFMITRKMQQLGASLFTESGREHILYGVEMNRDNLEPVLEILQSISLHPCFKPWEVATMTGRLKTELLLRSPEVIAIDLLHGAAFRNTGLGNSIFVPDHHIGKLSTEQLSNFVSKTHTQSRMAVVGLGVDHEELLKYTKNIKLTGEGDASGESPYGGGELRFDNGSSHVVVCLAGQGPSFSSKDAPSQVVAQYLLGTAPGTKYGGNASSKLMGILQVADVTGTACAINVNYSDAGLFGFLVDTSASSAHKAVKAMYDGIRSLKITDKEVANAKKKAKSAVHMALESSDSIVEDMGLQALLAGKYYNAEGVTKAIDSVSLSAVQNIISKAFSGKLSMASVGGTQNVPYLDQL